MKTKNNERFGTVFVVIFDNDGTDEPRVFTEREKAFTFAECLNGKQYTIFEETLDRGESELKDVYPFFCMTK